jgi:DNA polymerase-3 subunit gamma/tau
VVTHLAEHAADFANVLSELIARLHRIAILQIIPTHLLVETGSASQTSPQTHSSEETMNLEFSQQISKADVHLYHQIALLGRRDLPLFPDPRMGLEMTLLRMLAFRPVTNEITTTNIVKPVVTQTPSLVDTPYRASLPQISSVETHHRVPQVSPPNIGDQNSYNTPQTSSLNTSNVIWNELLPQLRLSGMANALAANCILKNSSHNSFELILDPMHAALLNKNLQARLNEALNKHFNDTVKLTINVSKLATSTPAMQQAKLANDKQIAATKEIENDATVKKIIDTFGATVEQVMIND